MGFKNMKRDDHGHVISNDEVDGQKCQHQGGGSKKFNYKDDAEHRAAYKKYLEDRGLEHDTKNYSDFMEWAEKTNYGESDKDGLDAFDDDYEEEFKEYDNQSDKIKGDKATLSKDQEEMIDRWAKEFNINPEEVRKRISDRVNINEYSLKDAFNETMDEVRSGKFKEWLDEMNGYKGKIGGDNGDSPAVAEARERYKRGEISKGELDDVAIAEFEAKRQGGQEQPKKKEMKYSAIDEFDEDEMDYVRAQAEKTGVKLEEMPDGKVKFSGTPSQLKEFHKKFYRGEKFNIDNFDLEEESLHDYLDEKFAGKSPKDLSKYEVMDAIRDKTHKFYGYSKLENLADSWLNKSNKPKQKYKVKNGLYYPVDVDGNISNDNKFPDLKSLKDAYGEDVEEEKD